MRPRSLRISFLAFVLSASFAQADDMAVLFGTGPQPGSDQGNSAIGIEYSFFRFDRSRRQSLQLGVSYTRLHSDTGSPQSLYAVSVFPQLTFYPGEGSKLALSMPENTEAFFYTRMLGPTYISQSSLGLRNQANHFAFLAQVGTGILYQMRNERSAIAHVSWRHYSNANLFSPNDGIDVPFVITLGMRF